ncbi:MAG: hypothetical protein JNK56_25475, partial [Myxococcales bacterium]|nr:hypothetical protein [Myxococcales bacterium]
MPSRSHRTLVLLALLGCTFDATGLGADGSGAASSTTTATTGTTPGTTTGVGPGAAPTSDPASGSGSAEGSGTTTTGPGVTSSGSSGEPPAVCGDGEIAGDEACDDG